MSTNTEQKQQHLLGGLSVAILAVNGFEQVEMTGPREALEELGVMTRLVSVNPGQIQGMHHDRPGDMFDVDLTFDKAEADAFDAVLLPGGVKNADTIRSSVHAQQFVQAIDREGKPLAVICHGPWLLISAGLVKGRTLTSWPSLEADVRNAGGRWVDEAAVVDGNWVSSRKPADIPAFNARFMELLAQRVKESVRGTADAALSSAGTGG
ncbi:MAG: type 1 glutamine amidotransferase domain-containing protein [Ramlibacter sp.]